MCDFWSDLIRGLESASSFIQTVSSSLNCSVGTAESRSVLMKYSLYLLSHLSCVLSGYSGKFWSLSILEKFSSLYTSA